MDMSFDLLLRAEGTALLNLINAQCGDCQMTCLESFDPPLSLDVPQMELSQFERSVKKP